jgi:hypothetical protein
MMILLGLMDRKERFRGEPLYRSYSKGLGGIKQNTDHYPYLLIIYL